MRTFEHRQPQKPGPPDVKPVVAEIETSIFHNGDLHDEGMVHIQHVSRSPTGKAVSSSSGFQVPQQALVAFVAELVRNKRIENLEMADAMEVLLADR